MNNHFRRKKENNSDFMSLMKYYDFVCVLSQSTFFLVCLGAIYTVFYVYLELNSLLCSLQRSHEQRKNSNQTNKSFNKENALKKFYQSWSLNFRTWSKVRVTQKDDKLMTNSLVRCIEKKVECVKESRAMPVGACLRRQLVITLFSRSLARPALFKKNSYSS